MSPVCQQQFDIPRLPRPISVLCLNVRIFALSSLTAPSASPFPGLCSLLTCSCTDSSGTSDTISHRTSCLHVCQQRRLTITTHDHPGSLQLAALLPARHDSARCPLLPDKDDQIATDPHCTFHKALATRFGLHLADPRLQPHHVAHLTLLVLDSTSSRSQLQ